MSKVLRFEGTRKRLTTWLLAAILGPPILTGTLVYFHAKESLRTDAISKLTAIRDLKVREIDAWLANKTGDTKRLARDPDIRAFGKICRNPEDSIRSLPHILDETRQRFRSAVRNHYDAVFLIDAKSGKIIASSAKKEEGVSKAGDYYLTEALQTRKAAVKDIYISAISGEASMAFSAPVFCLEHQGRHIASVVVMRVLLAKSLYPLLLDRVGMGRSGETLIVNKNSIALTDLRWEDDAPFRLRIRAEPSRRASRGETGVVESRDYRNEPVLAAFTHIPRMGWGFVAKQDLSEIRAPIRALLLKFSLIILAAIVLAGIFAWLLLTKLLRPAIKLEETASGLREAKSNLQKLLVDTASQMSQTELKFAKLWDSASDGMAVADAETRRVTSTNKKMCELFGYSAEEMLQLKIEDLHGKEDASSVLKMFSTLSLNESKTLPELPFRKRNGSVFYADFSAVMVVLGDVPCVLGTFRDVTEKKLAAAKLTQSRQEWHDVFDVIGDAITVHDLDYNILRMNKAAENLLGEKSSVVLGKKCFQNYHGTDCPPDACPFRKTIKTGTPAMQEVFEPHLGKYVRIEAWPRFDADKKLTGILHVVKDITKEKQAKEDLDKSRDQFNRSQKLEVVGQLAAGIAHDFNNILTAIGAYAGFIKEDAGPKDSKRADAEAIGEAVHKAAMLTRQLLAFGRKQVLKPRVIDLNDVVRDMDKLLKRTLPENIETSVKLAPGLDTVKIDPGQIEHVILNLAVNARDAMPEGGKFIIETSNSNIADPLSDDDFILPPGGYVVLAVSDTGMGMDEKIRSRVFEPFFTTKPVGKGTGLGLASAYGIVKQSGGYISVYSEPGQGTTFKIYLPRLNERADKNPQERHPLEDLRGSETVLLVEDDKGVRDTSNRILRNCGYRVLVAADAGEALRISERETKEPIHLMVTDVVMPGINGVALAKKMILARPKLKLLFVSGYTTESLAQREILSKDSAFLNKPFEPRALAAEVRRVLDSD